MTESLSYCAAQVRRYDRDRFLTCLFAPAERREALFALYAFNLEVAKTAEVVNEATLGQIRLQWWRETLESVLAGRAPDHAVALALGRAVQESALSPGYLERLIEARERDLDPAPPPDLDSLERYAVETSATLVWLALEALGVAAPDATRAGRHVGIAWSLVGLLRAVPFHAHRRRLYLPEDHLAVAGVDRRDLFELRGSAAISGVVMRLAKRAREHLAAARAQAEAIPGPAVPALLPARLADHYLARLERARFDPFDPRLRGAAGAGVARLALSALRGRY